MHNIVFILIILTILVMILLACKINNKEPFFQKSTLIFTCTTCFGKPNKFNQFVNAINSIQSTSPSLIQEWIVINEYSEQDLSSYANIIKNDYPFIKYIQKDHHHIGQARSLNMILEFIKPYEFWIHWEESWIAKDVFIDKALAIMQNNPSLSQLQFTPDWRDLSNERLIQKNGYIEVLLDKSYNDIDHSTHELWKMSDKHGLFKVWPLYSLRPSINRVSHTYYLQGFDENPELWPIKFEYEYSVRWIDAGCIKGVIEPPIAFRQDGHVSTY